MSMGYVLSGTSNPTSEMKRFHRRCSARIRRYWNLKSKKRKLTHFLHIYIVLWVWVDLWLMRCLHSAHGSRLPSWPLLPRWPPEQAWWHGSVYITRPLWSNAGDCWSVTVGWSNAGLRSVTWPPLRRSCPRYLWLVPEAQPGSPRVVDIVPAAGPCILYVVRLAMYTLCGMLGCVYR